MSCWSRVVGVVAALGLLVQVGPLYAAEPSPAPPVPATTAQEQASAEATPAAAPVASEPTPAPAKPSGLDYLSYFDGDAYKSLREACVAWDPAKCLPALERARAKETDEEQKVRLGFLYAQTAFEGRDYSRALIVLRDIEGRYPLMADYIHYYMGRIAFAKRDYQEAIDHYGEIPESSRLAKACAVQTALAAARLKKPEARATLEALLIDPKVQNSLPDILLAVADLTLPEEPVKARKLWWQVMSRWPETSYAEVAEQNITKHRLAPLSRDEKIRLSIAKAKKLRKKFQYTAAAKALKKLLDEFPKDDDSSLRGVVLYHHGRAYYENRQYAKAIENFAQVAATKASAYMQGIALRDRISSHLKRGEEDKAIVLAQGMIQDMPTHKKICEVYSLLAKAYKENGDLERALDTFNKIAELFPCSAKTAEALWYAGWLHFRAKRYEEAKKAFTAILEGSTERFERERAQYWMARIARRQGDKPGAIEQYRSLVRMYPLTYYSILAAEKMIRLGGGAPEEYKNRKSLSGLDVLAEINGEIGGVLTQDLFKRGMELFRLGRVKEAKSEFDALVDSNPSDDLITTATAYMIQLSGDVAESVRVLRNEKRNYQRSYPGSGTRAAWALAYPMPYAPLLDKYATQFGVDKFLMLALIREESSFNPEVMSYAHALGLTQIIAPTGKRIARKLKERFHFQDLAKPDTSIRFGTFHVSELLETFKGNHALAIAAYNAGAGAVKRWMGRNEKLPMDIFIEEIPYSQTCKYTRRVLRSYGIYRFLYSDNETGFKLWRNVTRN